MNRVNPHFSLSFEGGLQKYKILIIAPFFINATFTLQTFLLWLCIQPQIEFYNSFRQILYSVSLLAVCTRQHCQKLQPCLLPATRGSTLVRVCIHCCIIQASQSSLPDKPVSVLHGFCMFHKRLTNGVSLWAMWEEHALAAGQQSRKLLMLLHGLLASIKD